MSDIPIKVASPLNYPNPCDKYQDDNLGLKTYLVSHVNQNNPELKKHTDPLTSHYDKVNNAAQTNAPDIYYSGLEGGCLQGSNPDVNPLGGNWYNNCKKKVDGKHNYDLGPFFSHSPGGSSEFDDEQKAILESLNEVIPGFNQLHISNEQFCKYDNNWYYVPETDDKTKVFNLGSKVTDGTYNPTVCSSGENDILCQYFLCPESTKTVDGFPQGAKCGATNNPLYVMKDTQQYKQTLDGQYLDGIGPKNVDNIIKNEKWKDKYGLGHCVSPSDSNCKTSDIKGWVAIGKEGQGTETCLISGPDGFCLDPDWVTNLPEASYPNAPVLTTGGTCYYAGVGGYSAGPAGLDTRYHKGGQYHDRYVKNPKYSSATNKWNYTGGTAYGMLAWDPKDDSNQITRALNSVFSPSDLSSWTNQSFDLSPYKAKCEHDPFGSGPGAPPTPNLVQNLQLAYPGSSTNKLSTENALTLTCPIACPYDPHWGVCKPRAVCGNLNAEQKALNLVNYQTNLRSCPIYCPAGPPTASSGVIRNYCTPQEGLYETICPPMGTNYSLVGKNLGMIEAPKQNSAFFHNHYVNPTQFGKDLKSDFGPSGSGGVAAGNTADFQNIFTSIETIGTGAPGGRGITGFDSDGYYQMPQGVNEAEEILCEYTLKKDTGPSTAPKVGKGAKPNFVDMLTDPRQVAWMWEGTAESGIPPKDHATQINTLGLYIRGKKTFNTQKQVNLNPNIGSIQDTAQCSIWQDQMIDLCMNHEVQDKDYCYRPPPGELEKSWRIRYPLDIPPPIASPLTNTVCPVLISKPQTEVWKEYHGMPDETAKQAINSEYNTGKYCKDWYHTMADTYSTFVDKSADVASEKFNIATKNYCEKIVDFEAVNKFNFECGCANADPGEFQNLHSSVVSAMMQGGPESLGQEQKYCYLGACDVGSVGSMQHDRLLDPRYGSWSYPEAPVIQNPHTSPCTRTRYRIPCLSPGSNLPPTPCWTIDPTHPMPDPYYSPATPVAMCPTPKCVDLKGTKFAHEEQINCSGYVSSSLQKCPNFSCEEMLMVEGSLLENDEINAGISICQRHGTGVDKRWQYDAALGRCIYTHGATTVQGPPAVKSCNDGTRKCDTLSGSTNDPYYYATYEACQRATSLEMKKLPRTDAPPPYPKSVFTDNQIKWSCNKKQCISALGVGEYTSANACEKFCGGDFEKSPIMLIIVILVALGIFVAMVWFAIHRYKKKYNIKNTKQSGIRT